MSPRRFMRCYVFSAALLLVSSFPAAAASTDTAWALRTWKSDDGLPNNHVTGLAQTPDGYLWVATFSRPARFDGLRFEDYFLRRFNIPANQKITALESGRDGLWLGTSHGHIIRLNSMTVTVFTNDLPDKVVQTLVEDGEGFLWATYQGGLVRCIRKDATVLFTSRDGLPTADRPDTYVCSLARDGAGRIWFAKSGQVGVFREGRFETLLQLPSTTARLAKAGAGGVWICSGGKLMRFEEGKPVKELGAFIGEKTDPSVLLEDRDGGVWIGTSDHGLFYYKDGHFENVPVSGNDITGIVQDREGNIWAGTESGGLDQLRPRVVELETVETGLPFGTVQSLCQEPNGTIWATAQNGLLLRKQEGAWETVSTNAGWPGGRATCVTVDKAGVLWIGTKDHALYRRQDGHFTMMSPADGLDGREIHSLLADRNGDLWIGEESPDMVQRLHDGRLETFPMPSGVRIIRAMTEDVAGGVWIGTSGGRLVLIRDGVIADQTALTTGAPLSIRCVRATADGGLWIGYADEGIGWWKDGRFVHLAPAQGFPEENVSQIIPDDRGWIWFGGDHGIFKARQRELEEWAAGRAAGVNYLRYGQSEGLFSLEANCGDSPGAIRTADQRLWMPMRTALAVIHLDRLREDSQAPPLLITRVAVDERPIVSYGGGVPEQDESASPAAHTPLRLPAGYHRLKFEFTALSFGAPENVRFRYRLDGLDDNWADGGTQRSVSYSRLAAGNYRFRLMACNSSGVWTEAETVFTFAVAPFVWQTWWFQVLMILGFTAIVVAIVRYISFRRLRSRLQKLEQQAALDKERARIARDIHDDLGGRLTEVELMLERAHRIPPEKLDHRMRQISATVRRAGESLDEIVWAVNPRHDALPRLLDYLGQYAVQFLQAAGVRCRVDFPDEVSTRNAPPEARHNLFLAVKEALNNVARHAGAAEIWLRVSLVDDALVVVIEDNGKGFDDAPDNQGADGLRNMRQRMAEIGGQCRVESRPGVGTKVILMLPLPPEPEMVPAFHERR